MGNGAFVAPIGRLIVVSSSSTKWERRYSDCTIIGWYVSRSVKTTSKDLARASESTFPCSNSSGRTIG